MSRRAPFRLAVLTSHPVQYQVPWYQTMAAHPEIDLEVLYCHHATPQEQAAAGFGVAFEWDRPLFEGYRYRLLKNVAPEPSVNTFRGLDCPEIAATLTAANYDAVLVSGWHYKSAWQAIWACWRNGVKVYVRGDSHLRVAKALAKRLIKDMLYRTFVPRLDACLCVGQWSREYFRHYGAKPDNIFRVPHTIDEDFFAEQFRQAESRRAELRARWQLADSDTVYLFSGKFVPKKRPLQFVQAIERAARSGAKVAGLMVGDGALRQECEQYVRERQVPIHFAGFLNQSEIVQAYVAADALILPSDGNETWGLVVNEAMYCRRPAFVSSEVGAGPDLVLPGQTGEVFPLGDVAALAGHVARYDRAALATLGENAFRQVQRCSRQEATNGVLAALAHTVPFRDITQSAPLPQAAATREKSA